MHNVHIFQFGSKIYECLTESTNGSDYDRLYHLENILFDFYTFFFIFQLIKDQRTKYELTLDVPTVY